MAGPQAGLCFKPETLKVLLSATPVLKPSFAYCGKANDDTAPAGVLRAVA